VPCRSRNPLISHRGSLIRINFTLCRPVPQQFHCVRLWAIGYFNQFNLTTPPTAQASVALFKSIIVIMLLVCVIYTPRLHFAYLLAQPTFPDSAILFFVNPPPDSNGDRSPGAALGRLGRSDICISAVLHFRACWEKRLIVTIDTRTWRVQQEYGILKASASCVA